MVVIQGVGPGTRGHANGTIAIVTCRTRDIGETRSIRGIGIADRQCTTGGQGRIFRDRTGDGA